MVRRVFGMWNIQKVSNFDQFKIINRYVFPLAWHFCSMSSTNKMEKLQERALRFINNDFTSSLQDLLSSTSTRLLARYARPPPSWGIWQTYPIFKINHCRIECKMFALCIWWPECVTACYICYPR